MICIVARSVCFAKLNCVAPQRRPMTLFVLRSPRCVGLLFGSARGQKPAGDACSLHTDTDRAYRTQLPPTVTRPVAPCCNTYRRPVRPTAGVKRVSQSTDWQQPAVENWEHSWLNAQNQQKSPMTSQRRKASRQYRNKLNDVKQGWQHLPLAGIKRPGSRSSPGSPAPSHRRASHRELQMVRHDLTPHPHASPAVNLRPVQWRHPPSRRRSTRGHITMTPVPPPERHTG